MLHAEPLLLVDHEQAEILEAHVVGEQPVRADDDVDGALLHAAHHFGLFLRRQEAREHFDAHGIVREPLAERLAVLAGEQRRGHEDRDLLAVEHGLRGRAQRDLGLAVSDVTAHEAIHGDGPLHVGLRVDDRLRLIGRLLVRERLLDLGLERAVGRERVTRRREAAPVEHDELARDVAHRAAHAGARLLPVGAAHLRQPGRLTARVLPDEPDVLGVDVDAVAALELHDETVARDAEHLARLHPEVAPDAVHAVHDEVALRETFVVVGAPARRAGAGARGAGR